MRKRPGPGRPEQPTPPAVDAEAMRYAVAGDLSAVRSFVADRAVALGLSRERAALLTVAVSELTTNTLQHTSGGGHVRVWADGDQLICDVVDQGPLRTFGREMPASDAVRGRGLAIVERVCDDVAVFAVTGGTLVRVRLDL